MEKCRAKIKHDVNYRHVNQMSGVVTYSKSNDTKMSRSSGKIMLNCEWCNLAYETYACWAKRTSNHFCSMPCHAEWQKKPIICNCEICGKEFNNINSKINKIKTCSRECMKIKRHNDMKKFYKENPKETIRTKEYWKNYYAEWRKNNKESVKASQKRHREKLRLSNVTPTKNWQEG